MSKIKDEDRKQLIRRAEAILQIVVFTILYYITWKIAYSEMTFPYLGRGKYILMGVYAVFTVILFYYSDSFDYGNKKLSDIIVSQWIAIVLVNFLTYWQLCLISNVMITAVPMLLLVLIDVLVSMACCFVYNLIYLKYQSPRDLLMIYGSENALDLEMKMSVRSDKYHITEKISADAGFEKICEKIGDHDSVLLNDVPAQIRNDILKYCYTNAIRVYVTPKLSDIIISGGDEISMFDTPILLVKGNGLTLEQRFVKRAMDIILCSIAMIVAAPIMLVVAIAIKLEDGGPVFFNQKRATIDGKTFDILKFRSMIVDAEKFGEVIPATERDPRITKVGSIIRATRIDELPQILNILKGEMSIVGPRPERVEHVEKYSKEIPEFSYRLKVKGGLTGYAQIYGKYNTSAYDKLRLDLMYIEKYSLLLDIKLILMTLQIMLRKESTEGFKNEEKTTTHTGD